MSDPAKQLAKRFGPARLTTEVTKIRTIFRYLESADHIDRQPKYGPLFKGASRKEKRKLRNSKPPRLWAADQLRSKIDAAKQPLRSWILLGINCGFAPHDVAAVPLSAFDLDSAWLRFPRPKTEVQRTCPLWPETVAAIREFVAGHPSGGEQHGPLFISRRGESVADYKRNAVGQAFAKLCKSLGIVAPGVGFYGIRHTFQTIGEGCRDSVSVKWIMGHAEDASDMSAIYREAIDPARLVAVTDHVRNWLGFA